MAEEKLPSSWIKDTYGSDVFVAIQDEMSKALAEVKGNEFSKRKFEHFKLRNEPAPKAKGFQEIINKGTDIFFFELVCELVVFAPEVWYKVFTGKDPPKDAKNDWSNIGVAFDASSRLRRAGIEHFHWKLTDHMATSSELPDCRKRVFHLPHDVDENNMVKDRSVAVDALPRKPNIKNLVRIVAIADTHLFHHKLDHIPAGDILVHGGDISYEESRSPDSKTFNDFAIKLLGKGGSADDEGLLREALDHMASGKVHFDKFFDWFRAAGLEMEQGLRWLKEKTGFAHKVVVGGNHDYVLCHIGTTKATQLCKQYGVTYLHTASKPVKLDLRQAGGPAVSVWGSGISMGRALGAEQAAVSGNVTFQINKDRPEELTQGASKLGEGTVDIMITHGPPHNKKLLGKEGNAVTSVTEVVERVKPSVYICGHIHNKPDVLHERYDFFDCKAGDKKTVGVNASCLGEWNHFHGMAVVIDRIIPDRHSSLCNCGIQ